MAENYRIVGAETSGRGGGVAEQDKIFNKQNIEPARIDSLKTVAGVDQRPQRRYDPKQNGPVQRQHRFIPSNPVVSRGKGQRCDGDQKKHLGSQDSQQVRGDQPVRKGSAGRP